MAQVTAYIGLGANLGDARNTVLCAIDALANIPETQLQAQSRLYASAPMGENATGDHYVNAVVQLRTHLSAHDLLSELHRIERAFGRERSARNAPRTLDLDILLYGNACIEDEVLSIPHPRMHERAFVLRPLFDIAPELSWHNAYGQKINLASQLKYVAQQEIQLLGATA
jgi:2-amino-4-hydroxy-6-hydroxymethyldihydropteridine diphosphokinase